MGATIFRIAEAERKRRALYSELCRLAATSLPCPSNAVLARVVGYNSPDSLGNPLDHLAAEGLIERETRGNLRQITITATGARTASPFREEAVVVQPKRPVREIAETVIAHVGASRKDVLGRSRFREHVRPRQMIFALSVREGWSSKHIARVMGYDHTTVLHARDEMPLIASAEPDVGAVLRELTESLPPLPEMVLA